MPPDDDLDELLVATRAGAGWAFERIFRLLSPSVAGYLRAHGAVDADDLTSEVFLGVHRNLGDFSGDADGFRSWVFTIAHRRLVDERRRRGRRPGELSLDPAEHDLPGLRDDPQGELDEQLRLQRVHALLDELSEAQRDVVLLRVLGGLSAEEVGDVLGIRPATVRVRQHRALSALRRRIEDEV